jgi:protoporphyrin/coproporphyrin ferrochelatase
MHGVLLINIGSPKSTRCHDVRAYLHQFLLDKRVIAKPRLLRELLVRGIIVPLRLAKVISQYKKLGFPLISNSLDLQEKLGKALGEHFQVEIAMRYQEPSIEKALTRLQHVETLTILPLFPQYASASTGSAIEAVMQCMSQWELFPTKKVSFITSFWRHPLFLDAWAALGRQYDIKAYDHILFSFHGLPVKQDPGLKYQQACLATAEALSKLLQIEANRYTVTFQSRVGNDTWLQPYTTETIEALPKKGVKKLLIFSPAFIADCLETTFELGVEARDDFIKAGGEMLDVVTSLNSSPEWIKALSTIIKES